MHNIWSFVKRYKFSLLIVAVILFLSFFKPPHTELDNITNFDKFVHFSMYACFSAVIWLEYLVSHKVVSDGSKHSLFKSLFFVNRLQLVLCAVVMPIALSGIIELGQEYLTSHRGGDWWDFASNSTGVLVSALCGYFFLRRRKCGRGK